MVLSQCSSRSITSLRCAAARFGPTRSVSSVLIRDSASSGRYSRGSKADEASSVPVNSFAGGLMTTSINFSSPDPAVSSASGGGGLYSFGSVNRSSRSLARAAYGPGSRRKWALRLPPPACLKLQLPLPRLTLPGTLRDQACPGAPGCRDDRPASVRKCRSPFHKNPDLYTALQAYRS